MMAVVVVVVAAVVVVGVLVMTAVLEIPLELSHQFVIKGVSRKFVNLGIQRFEDAINKVIDGFIDLL